MELYTTVLHDVTPLRVVTSSCTYGVGLLTYIVHAVSNIFGIESDMYNKKIKMAEKRAVLLLKKTAENIGATGIMDIHYQIDGTTVFVSGTAYKKN